MSHPSSPKGMTIIELMVALSILAILLSLAAPSMSRFASDWRLSNAVNAFSGSLRVARAEAVASSRPVILCRTVSLSESCAAPATTSPDSSKNFSTGWMVFVDYNNNGQRDRGEKIILQQGAFSGIQDINPRADMKTNIRFLPSGTMNSPGLLGLGLNFTTPQYDTTAQTPWAIKAMCISSTGRVRMVPDAVECR